MKSVVFALTVFLLATLPANAAPVGALIAALSYGGGALAGLSIWAAAYPIWAIAGKLAFSTLLQGALRRKPKTTVSGISRESTTSGGVTPQSFVLGYYASAGHAVCPNLSHGTNNRYQTYIIDLGDIPIATLHQVMINNDLVDFSGAVHADYGTEAVGKYAGKAWLKFHDGTQTVADQMLLDKYGAHPDYPWSADMVGTGVPYAIITFDYDREIYSGYPTVRFVVDGIKLYDPRKDTTVGGAGTQRWANPATWAFSINPAVMVYNIKRNISLADGSVWGLSVGADDLDVSEWAAAMNVCEESVALAAGGTEPRYRAGLEVSLDQEPLAVIEELLKGCSGEVAEVGGQWHIQIGDPALPIYFMTDDDIIRTKDSSYQPFPSLEGTYNAITASHPLPENNWEVHDAAPIYNAEWEAADGGRRLTAHVDLGGVPYKGQVQRLMQEYIKDERRMRRHTFVLPPEALICRPLQTIAWTSARNQYDAKLFAVGEQVVDTSSLCSQLSVRERDPSDYNWLSGDERPDVTDVRTVVTPPSISLEGFGVVAIVVQDGEGANRRPAIKVFWDTPQNTFQGVEWEVRTKANAVFVTSGSTSNVVRGFANITEGILPGEQYEIKASPISASPTLWSGWATVTTDDIRIGPDNFDDEFWEAIDDQAQQSVDRLYGNMDFAFDQLAAIDLAGRVNSVLEDAKVEGVVEQTKLALSAEIEGVSATLTQQYYTVAQVDAAISAITTNLTSQISGISATLTQQYYTVAQTNSAISAATVSLNTTVNGLSTTVSTVASSVDGVMGTYGVKVNNNGVINGFGLVSELIAGTVTSNFDVVADKFRISGAQGAEITSVFEVHTTGSTINGVYAPPGAYMKEAIIRNGTITNAKIGTAEVDTLKIQGNAVTIPKSQSVSTAKTGNAGWQECNSVQMTLPQSGQVTLIWTGSLFYSSLGSMPGLGVRFKINGSVVRSRITGSSGDSGIENDWLAFNSAHSLAAGTHTISVEWFGETSVVTLRLRTLTAMGTMR